MSLESIVAKQLSDVEHDNVVQLLQQQLKARDEELRLLEQSVKTRAAQIDVCLASCHELLCSGKPVEPVLYVGWLEEARKACAQLLSGVSTFSSQPVLRIKNFHSPQQQIESTTQTTTAAEVARTHEDPPQAPALQVDKFCATSPSTAAVSQAPPPSQVSESDGEGDPAQGNAPPTRHIPEECNLLRSQLLDIIRRTEMSQRQLACLLGVSQGPLSTWMKKKYVHSKQGKLFRCLQQQVPELWAKSDRELQSKVSELLECPAEETRPCVHKEPNPAKAQNLIFPPETSARLFDVFVEYSHPPKALRVQLAEELGLRLDQVTKWFSNARYRTTREGRSSSESHIELNPSVTSPVQVATPQAWSHPFVDPATDLHGIFSTTSSTTPAVTTTVPGAVVTPPPATVPPATVPHPPVQPIALSSQHYDNELISTLLQMPDESDSEGNGDGKRDDLLDLGGGGAPFVSDDSMGIDDSGNTGNGGLACTSFGSFAGLQ